MTARHRLPERRQHEGLSFRHGGFDFTAGVGRFDDGRLAELFLTGSKSGTAIDAWTHDAAIVASLALQHGVAPETIRHAVGRENDGTAATALGALLDLLGEEASR